MINHLLTVSDFYPYLLGLCALALVARLLHNKYGHGIHHLPGPRLAAYTDLWRLWVVWRRRPEQVHIALHEKYGSLVRLGPKAVSISDPEAIKTIYALNSGFVKSDFYPVQQSIAKGRPLPSLFNTTDEKYHAKLRRAVANAYTMSTLVQFEPLVDSTTRAFLDQLTRRYADCDDDSGICDFGTWLQYYAFDVIGELTFSKRLGFVDRGVDVDSIIANVEWALGYFSVVGQIPILDRVFLKNPIRLWLTKIGLLNATSPVVVFTRKRMADRADALKEKHDESRAARRDFLSRFIESHHKDPEFITPERVLSLAASNVFAGSDTTAISLRAIFYFLLRNPSKQQKLMDEFRRMEEAGVFHPDDPLVKWNDVRDLPYLSAVIKEALRCHPAVGLPLERIVPAAGVTVAGQFLPGGTNVGCSAWTVHRDKNIFGPDPDVFRPERWIEASGAKQSEMNGYLFAFGAGARTCSGKNISLLEMHKLVPAVLRSFEISFAYPEREWKLHNAWFVKQSEFYVRFKSRKRHERENRTTALAES
ncbi:hypothetical protein VTN77DRAFT_3630 [Rasamsonia byssochlamydoides]|uniref:uncharacterized protein n=1 Tax=Rasamsonia byssochlamydoides TaxID=89139 RepID=UPI003744185E